MWTYPEIVRNTIREIGYSSSQMGFDWRTCSVLTSLGHQSPDIAQGVNTGEGLHEEQGAGDQRLMFGYATDETPELMPMPIMYAHKLTQRLATVRKNSALDFLRPDGKSQVTIEYENGTPLRVDTVVVSSQHKPDVTYDELKDAIIEEVIKKVIPREMIDGDTRYFINPTGRFVIGGPMGDCGLTGRKIIVGHLRRTREPRWWLFFRQRPLQSGSQRQLHGALRGQKPGGCRIGQEV